MFEGGRGDFWRVGGGFFLEDGGDILRGMGYGVWGILGIGMWGRRFFWRGMAGESDGIFLRLFQE